MPDPEASIARSFGMAFRMVEALVQADVLVEARRTVGIVFGDSPEYRLVRVLTRAQEPLPLKEICARCGGGRRTVLRDGV